MPKVRPLTEEGRWAERNDRIVDSCILAMRKANVKQVDIAKKVGKGRSSVSMQFKSRHLTLDTVLAVIELTGTEPNSIIKVW